MTETKRAVLKAIASGWGLNLSPDPAAALDELPVSDVCAEKLVAPALHGLPVPIVQGGDIVSDRFEYERLGPDARAILQQEEERLDEIERRSAIDKGKVLRAIKAAIVGDIGHGYWLAWLAARKIPETTARCWMRAADWADESAIVADMDLGAISRGARAPDEVKTEIVRRLQAGETVNLADVIELIKLHKNSMPKKGRGSAMRATRPGRVVGLASESRGDLVGSSTEHAKKAAEDVVTTLRVFFDDDEISVLNARWHQATFGEIESLLHKSDGSRPA